MRRIALLSIVLLAALFGGRPAAAQTAPGAIATPAPERPYFLQVTCEAGLRSERDGVPVANWICYGRVADNGNNVAGLRVEYSIELDDDSEDCVVGVTNEDGGFYQQFTIPRARRGNVYIKALSSTTGLWTQEAAPVITTLP